MNISLSASAPENLVSRDGFGSPVPRQPAHLHTQAESSAHILRDSSRRPQRRPLLYFKRRDAIESVPSLSDHAIAHRWRSLPRVHRHRASKPLLIIGSSKRVLPFCRSPRVCVFFLPIHSGHQVRWTYQPGSHRISHPPSFCGACLNFSREEDSAIPFPRRS